MITPLSTRPKILVAVAVSSDESLLPAAVAEARWRGADLVLLRVISSASPPSSDAPARPTESGATLLARSARAELATLCAQVPADVGVGVRVAFGAPWQVIGEVARAEGAALIVVGAHDRRPLDGLLGTTTARVLNHADRSVLVARPRRP